MQAAHSGLLERLAHDGRGDAANFDVHLQRGHAIFSAADLEIHIAQRVFGTQNVGQDGVFISLHHQTHRHTRHHRLDGYARVHQAQAARADGGHAARAVTLEHISHHSNYVGKLFKGRKNRTQSAFGQNSVAHFTA